MFVRLGRFVVRTRVAMLVAGLIVVIIGGAWGSGVTATGVLSQGGLEDTSSESFQAMERIGAEVGRQDADVIALYTNPDGAVTDPDFRQAVTGALSRTAADDNVEQVFSPFDAGLPAAERASLVSKDKSAVYAVVQLRGADDDQRMQSYLELKKAEGAPPQQAPPRMANRQGVPIHPGRRSSASTYPRTANRVDRRAPGMGSASDKVQTLSSEFVRWDYDPVFGQRDDKQQLVPRESKGEIVGTTPNPDKGLSHITETRTFIGMKEGKPQFQERCQGRGRALGLRRCRDLGIQLPKEATHRATFSAGNARQSHHRRAASVLVRRVGE